MAKNKISEYSSVASNNTDISGINIAEGCAPSGINNAIRELMAQLKDQQAGTDGDGFVVGGAFTSSGGAVFSSGTTFSGSVVMSAAVTMSNNVIMSGTTNTIGTTTSSTILSGSVTQTSGSVLYLDAAATTSAAPPLSWSGDTNTGIYRPAADTLALVTGGSDRLRIGSTGIVNIGAAVVIGTGDATTSVAGSILRGPSSAGTNIAGANLEIQAGNGTGTGGSGSIVLKTADVGSSGSTANTLTQRLLITPKGGFSFGDGATSYGTAGQVLKSNGDAPPSFGSAITAGTDVSASGTSVDFANIPSWVKRITVMFQGVSTNASAFVQVQLGTNGSPQTTGYGSCTFVYNSSSSQSSTSGFIVSEQNTNTYVRSGHLIICKLSDTIWTSAGTMLSSASTGVNPSAGYVTMTGDVDLVRITTIAGTATFDAGSINILYE
jgi:hypothetical protein